MPQPRGQRKAGRAPTHSDQTKAAPAAPPARSPALVHAHVIGQGELGRRRQSAQRFASGL